MRSLSFRGVTMPVTMVVVAVMSVLMTGVVSASSASPSSSSSASSSSSSSSLANSSFEKEDMNGLVAAEIALNMDPADLLLDVENRDHFNRITRTLMRNERLKRKRLAYQRKQAKLYRDLLRRAKTNQAKSKAKFLLFKAKTAAARAKEEAMKLRLKLHKDTAYVRWRKRIQAMKKYNHLRGFRGKRFDIRPCLKLCKSVLDMRCYRGCYRMAFRHILKREEKRMVALFPKDRKYRSCASKSYNYEYLSAGIHAKRERRESTNTRRARVLDHERITGVNAADNAALALGSDNFDDVDDANSNLNEEDHGHPSWRDIADQSMEHTLAKDSPVIERISKIDLLVQIGGGNRATRNWAAHWARVRDRNRRKRWLQQQMNGMKRDAIRRKQDAERKRRAIAAVRRRERQRVANEKVARELAHEKERKSLGNIRQKSLNAARRKQDAAGIARKKIRDRIHRLTAIRLRLKRKVHNRARREVTSNAIRVEHLRARTMMMRHQHELHDFLHEARQFNERCLRAAQRRASLESSVTRTGLIRERERRAPADPLKDKDLIYRMTLDTSKKVIRRWLLHFRALKRNYIHNLRMARDSRRELGDDGEIPGHMQRNGQGPPHWLFDSGLAAGAPDKIAVSKFVAGKR